MNPEDHRAGKSCSCRDFVEATQAAALAAGPWMGQGDGGGARVAATEAMRSALDVMAMSGRIVVSKGQRPDDPLPVGHTLGAGGCVLDLAVDALEGTDCLARGEGGAMAVLLVGDPDRLMQVPEMYMQKLAVGAKAARAIDLDLSVSDNLRAIAQAHGRKIGEITAVILDRPRHEDLIDEVRQAGARIKLIGDGDISAAISAAVQGTGTHVYVGIGGASEGVITAGALRCLGGEMQVRFWPLSRREIERARDLGIDDIETKLSTADMVQGDVIFAATGVTDGEFLRGVGYFHDGARTHSLLMCTACRQISFIDTIHLFSDERREIRLT